MCFLRNLSVNFTRKQKWWHLVFLTFYFFLCLVSPVSSDEYRTSTMTSAFLNLTYKDPVTGQTKTESEEMGSYGQNSRIDGEYGWVVHVRTADNKTHGCTPPVNVPSERWIALIRRGMCKFEDKIKNAAVIKNASAVVIYNNIDEPLLAMDHNEVDAVTVFISKKNGEKIAKLLDNGTKILMHIVVGRPMTTNHFSSINKTSVLFVSISFIVLMIISLAWLVFYYIQRFRYAHAKERLSKRLMGAAKKAITKMPMRTIKHGDKETEPDFDPCAICIEGYRASDVIRALPCKHLFHKSCVDPWLIEQRSCPMCKLDILKAYGLQVHGSRETVVNVDMEGPSTSLGPSEPVLQSSSGIEDSGVTGGVEIHVVHYQPARVDYHQAPEQCLNDNSPEIKHSKTKTRRSLTSAASIESVNSSESDSNELQSLMPLSDSHTPAGVNLTNRDLSTSTS